MERLTDKRMKGEGFIPVDHKEYKAILREEKPTAKQIYRRLLEIEDILSDDYDLERLAVMMNQCMSMRDEVQARFRLTAKIPLDQLKDLVEAKQDGRCVISPLASGDTIYFDAEDENNERTEEAYTVKDLRLYASVDMGYADWMIPLRDFDAKTCRRKEEEKGERDG